MFLNTALTYWGVRSVVQEDKDIIYYGHGGFKTI